MGNTDCIFCKIVSGAIPCTRLYEDEKALAFMDICPLNRGHLLVIPKEHYETIVEMDPDLYGYLAGLACRIAKAAKAALDPPGFNVMQLNGKAGNQVVPHVHIHLVPRTDGDGLTICAWEPIPGNRDDITAAAQLIKSRL